MFKKEDFELPMEKMLRLRMINDEVDNCKDVEQLQENLKQCAETLAKYQHLVGQVAKRVIEKDMLDYVDTMEREFGFTDNA